MSSEWELNEGIELIKSAWRREHTAIANLEKMLEQAEAERKQSAERCAKTLEVGTRWMAKAARFESENAKLRELLTDTLMQPRDYCKKYGIEYESWDSANAHLDARMCELGIEVDL